MRCERRRPSGPPEAEARSLRALVPSGDSVAPAVAEIIAAVRARGDEAVLELTGRLDAPQAPPRELAVAPERLTQAAEALPAELRRALELAIANVRAVASGWLAESRRSLDLGTHSVTLRREPVRRAAVYVPGGRAPYPSTVVMGVITARVAGVREVVVCSPPRADGEIDPVVLAACRLSGADGVFGMGGAQAVAALALGTATVPAVEVIVGPGNLYVQEAKHQLSARVGIDGFAGPSDLVLVAAGEVDPALLALDLLAQAEHGAGTLVVAISPDPGTLDAFAAAVEPVPDSGAVICLLQCADAVAAVALAEALAPEHLQLAGAQAEALAAEVRSAGCLFVGQSAGTAFGDYVAGSNHILPTGGAARFSSGLTPRHFQREMAEVRISDAAPLARAAAALARAEGFELHARSLEARIRDNGRREPPG